MVAQESFGVPELYVLRKNENADRRVSLADGERGPSSLVAMGRRHAHVGNNDIRSLLGDGDEQFLRISDVSDDLDVRVTEKAYQPGPEEDVVLSDHNAHGSTARTTVPVPAELVT